MYIYIIFINLYHWFTAVFSTVSVFAISDFGPS